MTLLGFYLELVMPKTYGRRRHPLFFLGCPWSKKKKTSTVYELPRESNTVDPESGFETKYLKKENFEPADIEFN
jgi:hypothetical protein